MSTTKSFSTHTYSFPHIIWVENIRASGLLLTVLAPRRSYIPPFRYRPKIIYTHPTIYYSSPDEESEYTVELIQIGTEHVPANHQYRVALSLADLNEVLLDTWGVTLPYAFNPRYPG